LRTISLYYSVHKDYAPVSEGRAKLLKWDAKVDTASPKRRHYARQYLDWSERLEPEISGFPA